MAKAKSTVKFAAHPEVAPNGWEFLDVKRTVGERKHAVLRVMVPKANAEGVLEASKYLTSILPKNGPDGVKFCAEAIRNAIVNSQVAIGKDSELDVVGTIIPRVSPLRVVDKAAVAGGRLQEFIAKHGRAPDSEEFGQIYAGLTL